MKVLLTLAFLFISAVMLFLGLRLQRTTLLQIRQKRTGIFKIFFFQLLILFLLFVQYWLLTRRPFPFFFFLLLIGAEFVGLLLNEIIGAISGFTIREKRHKVNILSTTMFFQEGLNHPMGIAVLYLSSLLLFGGWIAALVIFWRNPPGDPRSAAWIAIFVFVTPQVVNIINTLSTMIPVITSGYIDDDMRNANLSYHFSGILYSTIIFLFPFYIFYKEYAATAAALPPFWIIVTVPLILFFFLGVIPFFIGLNKYRNQATYFLEWRRNWLSDFKSALAIPDPVRRTTAGAEKEEELIAEINTRVTGNKMFQVLENIDAFVDNSSEQSKEAQEVFLILKNNKKNIEKWDIQLSFVEKLKEIQTNLDPNNLPGTKDFITESLENVNDEISSLQKGKNKISGVLIAAITAIIGFVFKAYQPELLSLLKDLNNYEHLR